LIKRRRVIYVHGYDPQGAVGYYRLFEHGWKKFKDVWSVRSSLGPLKIDSRDVASWTVTTSGPTWEVLTDYEFIRYEDIIEENLNRPIVWQIVAALQWLLGDLVSGATARIIRASWRFEIHHFLFQLLLMLWITISFGAGWLAVIAARNFLGLTIWAAVPLAIVIVVAVFYALRPLVDRFLVIRINNHWPYLRKFGRGQPTCFDRPINVGVARLIAAANADDVDEILLIGHSGGAPLVLPVMARALERDPDLGRHVPSVVVITLGSIMPAVALHPRAQWMRDIVRRIANEPSVQWIDCQSRKDVLQFWNVDPVAGIGVKANPQRRNPLVWQVRFRDVMLPERYRRNRMNFFRLHYQFIMASDRRAAYDYFMLTCGPIPAIDWAQRGREIAADWPAATATIPVDAF
jgi:hypothetical protein